jgi:anti-sigma regulatory factor (Ser/Thr protein kinase)
MAREIAEALEFQRSDQTRIATAVSEIARNVWQYAGGGEVFFELVPTDKVFQIRVRDTG